MALAAEKQTTKTAHDLIAEGAPIAGPGELPQLCREHGARLGGDLEARRRKPEPRAGPLPGAPG